MQLTKKTVLKFGTALLCLIVAVAFTACGGSDSSSSGSSAKKMKTYTVATEPTYPPLDTTNDNGEIDGFDMDLIKAIAKDQGFKVEFKNMEFGSLIPSLQSDDADIVIAAMKINKRWEKQVDFSDPYYKSGNYVMVKKDNNKIKGYESFKKGGKYIVCTQAGGTTIQTVAERLKKEGRVKKIVLHNQFTTCVEELKTGTVDAVLVDKPVGEYIIKQQKDQFKLVGSPDKATEGSYGIATKKGNTKLMKKINAGLKDVKEDGTYKKLLKKWGMKEQ